MLLNFKLNFKDNILFLSLKLLITIFFSKDIVANFLLRLLIVATPRLYTEINYQQKKYQLSHVLFPIGFSFPGIGRKSLLLNFKLNFKDNILFC